MRPLSGMLARADAVGVAGAVPALVVAAGDLLGQAHDARAAVAEDLGAEQRVRLHLVELVRRERPRLEQDRVAHGDLADVVEAGGDRDVLDEALVEAEQPRDAARERADAQRVLARLVMAVLGGVREALDQLVLGVLELGGALAHAPLQHVGVLAQQLLLAPGELGLLAHRRDVVLDLERARGHARALVRRALHDLVEAHEIRVGARVVAGGGCQARERREWVARGVAVGA